MDDIEHTIAELLGIPMEEWPDWLENRRISADAAHRIAERLFGDMTDALLQPASTVHSGVNRHPGQFESPRIE